MPRWSSWFIFVVDAPEVEMTLSQHSQRDEQPDRLGRRGLGTSIGTFGASVERVQQLRSCSWYATCTKSDAVAPVMLTVKQDALSPAASGLPHSPAFCLVAVEQNADIPDRPPRASFLDAGHLRLTIFAGQGGQDDGDAYRGL